jgi:protoheme IX farnesyltransferase
MEHLTKSYLQLIKPGITLSNTMTAAAGFLLAKSDDGFSFASLIGLIVGIALIIGASCVVNNIIDRDLDSKMSRTKKREIASGRISPMHAAIFAGLLFFVGTAILALFTNFLVLVLGVIAVFWYIVVYGIAKRTTPLSTIIGGVCGALPLVAGYVTVTGDLDMTALLLFVIMMVWQLPHFYAISIWRRKDYKQGGIPVWAVRYGVDSAKVQIFFWVVIYALLVPLLTLTHATGWTYLIAMLGVSIYWIFQGAKYYKKEDSERWAKRMFGVSLVVLLVFCAAISLSRYLP